MKRFLACALSILSIAMLLPVFAFTVSAADKPEAAPSNSGESAFIPVEDEEDIGNGITPTNTTVGITNAGGAKLFYWKNTVASGDTCVSLSPIGTGNALGMTDLEFYIDMSQITDYQPGLCFRIVDLKNNTSDVFFGSIEKMSGYQNGTWTEYSKQKLPAGFKGYVRIDVQEILDSISPYVGTANPIEPQYFSSMAIWYGTKDATAGKTIYMGDFKFINDGVKTPIANKEETEEPVIVEPPVPAVAPAPANSGELAFVNTELGKIYTITPATSEISAVDSNGKSVSKLKIIQKAMDFSIKFEQTVNAAPYDYLQFWADTTALAGAELAFDFAAYDAVSGVAIPGGVKAGNTLDIWLYADGVWKFVENNANGYIKLPADFSGYVRIDAKQLSAAGAVVYGGTGADLDMSQFNSIVFWTAAKPAYNGYSCYFGDVAFVNAAEGTMSKAAQETTVSPDTGSTETSGIPETAGEAETGATENPGTGAYTVYAALIVISGLTAAICLKKRK